MHRVAGSIPFQHVVVDLAAEHGEANVLVVANQTVLGEPLLAKIRERAAKSPAGFLIISPQGEAEGSYDEAEHRLLARRDAPPLARGSTSTARSRIPTRTPR